MAKHYGDMLFWSILIINFNIAENKLEYSFIFATNLFVVCFGFFVPPDYYHSYWCHYYRWRAAHFNLHVCSALVAIEQCGFFSEAHLLWHPFRMVISEDPWHTYCRAFGSEALTTCFHDLGLSRLGFENPTFRLRGECSNRLRLHRGFTTKKKNTWESDESFF